MSTIETTEAEVTDEELDELQQCEECGERITLAEVEEHGGYCPRCYGKFFRVCARCHDHYHVDDMGEEFPDVCCDCQEDQHTEVADALWEEVTDLVGSWSGEEYEIPRLRRLLAYAKQLSR